MLRAGCSVRRGSSRSSGGSPPLILDMVAMQAAAAAYSLRLLRAAYAGAAVNIRRSSDNATQDIGFVNGSLDTSSLAAFIGGGNGFVAKWYDQSGSGNDALQATTGNQPQLIVSVAGFTGRPGLQMTDGGALNVAVASFANPWASGGTVSTVVNYAAASVTTNDRLCDFSGSNLSLNGVGATGIFFAQNSTGNGSWTTSGGSFPTGAHVADVQYNNASLSNVAAIAIDGTVLSTTNTQPTGTVAGNTTLIVGSNAATGGIRGFPGQIGEFIIWRSQPAMAGVRANQKAYWGTR